jgi:hypothetical protein
MNIDVRIISLSFDCSLTLQSLKLTLRANNTIRRAACSLRMFQSLRLRRRSRRTTKTSRPLPRNSLHVHQRIARTAMDRLRLRTLPLLHVPELRAQPQGQGLQSRWPFTSLARDAELQTRCEFDDAVPVVLLCEGRRQRNHSDGAQ